MRRRHLARTASLLIALIALIATGASAAALEGFQPSPHFSEQVRQTTTEDGVRVYTNAGGDFNAARPTALIVYLLPNGNTIEQTLGCQMVEGLDWHYDIQHIAAQTRLLRDLDKSRNVVLTLMEAPKKSWPAYRQANPDNPTKIRKLVADATAGVGGTNVKVSLVGHSGGGSFMFGYLNAPEPIADNVERIAFLDANYSYSDDDKHGDKLVAWLKGGPDRRLVVFAYDDRNVTLDGKKIVSDTGGTFRASGRMIARLSKEQAPIQDQAGPFDHTSFFRDQAQFFLHPNPDLKILHTSMIGEMNAFLHAMTLGTAGEGKWGTLGGPRAYTAFVQPAPPGTTRPATTQSKPSTTASATESTPSNARLDTRTVTLELPPRPADAIDGRPFAAQIESVPPADRERETVRQILSGNLPPFMRTFKGITVTAPGPSGKTHTATYFVTPDVLAVGGDADFYRMPLTPAAAGQIATRLNCSLITCKMSNDIYAAAEVKLEPRPLTEKRDFASTFYQHHQIIEQQRQGKPIGALVAGHKKDVVISNRLKEKPNKVAIYGWHKPDGKAIQPLYVGHVDWYVDYSHGIRLAANTLTVDGRETTIAAVLADPELCGLLSDEGVIVPANYPPAAATQPSAK